MERFHGTLKSRLKRIRWEGRVPLLAAIQKVLYDLRSSTNDVTGETPFYRLFGRDMDTRLSRIRDGPTKQVTSRPRNVAQEYRKKWSVHRNYKIGSSVAMRKGDGTPFDQFGIVSGRRGKKSYEVRADDGRVRIYNQRNLKALTALPVHDHSYEEAEQAYDAVDHLISESRTDQRGGPIVQEFSHSQSSHTPRYPRRTRQEVDKYGVQPY